MSFNFKVIDFGTTGKLVSSACYGTQQVCVAEIARFQDGTQI